MSHLAAASSQDASPIHTILNDYSHYKPIGCDQEEIRIIVLHPATDSNSPILCSLVRTDLRLNAPCYEAISYCWGNLDDTAAVTIRHLEVDVLLQRNQLIKKIDKELLDFSELEGCVDDWAQYLITKSLHGALLRFRRSDQPRFLWADAICINQGDPTERSHQVQFMRSVYASAFQILVWLDGPSDPNFDAMEFLENSLLCMHSLAKIGDVTWDRIRQVRSNIHQLRKLWKHIRVASRSEVHAGLGCRTLFEPLSKQTRSQAHETPNVGRRTNFNYSQMYNALLGLSEEIDRHLSVTLIDAFQALENFISGQKWFTRIWVLQEVGSNCHVLLHHMDGCAAWECLEAASIMFGIVRQFARRKLFYKFPAVWAQVTPGEKRYRLPLVELLGTSSKLQATDGRDKIFAQLGLMEETTTLEKLPTLIRPDYTKSVGQVFRDFTHWAISSQKSLDILALVQNSHRRPISRVHVPSWVPNYARTLPRVQSTLGLCSPYIASRSLEPSIRKSKDSGVLILRGFQVETVSSVIRIMKRERADTAVLDLDHGSQLSCLLPESRATSSLCDDEKWAVEANNGLYRYIRCLGCTAPEAGVRSNGFQVRNSCTHKTANVHFASYWISLDPQLDGLTWSQKLHTSKLAHGTTQGDVVWADLVLADSLFRRQFFTTPKKDFGLCPKGTKPKDIVVILYGGSTPYVLRENPYPADMSLAERLEQGPTYTFIGECFLEKYMDGSAVDEVGFAEEGLQRFKYQKKAFTLV